jgi:hypothetical protein
MSPEKKQSLRYFSEMAGGFSHASASGIFRLHLFIFSDGGSAAEAGTEAGEPHSCPRHLGASSTHPCQRTNSRYNRGAVIVFTYVVLSFTVMAPVRQKIRELCEKKSSKPFSVKNAPVTFRNKSFAFQHSFTCFQSILIWRIKAYTQKIS